MGEPLVSALRPSNSRLCHKTAAAAATLTLAGGLIAAGAASAQALPWVPSTGGGAGARTAAGSGSATSGTAGASFVYARTVTGREVRVARPKFIATPIHPEKIAHAGRDFMGSTVAAHFHGPALKPTVANASAAKAGANTVSALPGIDVSGYQGNINWGSIAKYLDFAYAKATESTNYTNPYFTNQYNGPRNAYLKRGAYHFAIPNNSGGATQANYFMAHGGGWSGDNKTLPGALDIEYNPYGQECYNLTQSQMRGWIWSFVDRYAYKEHVYPVIYTTTDWWNTCVGNDPNFAKYDPLWIANYSASHGGTLPNGWRTYTFWQYADSGWRGPGDQDVFNGPYSGLKRLADKG
jgi:GH25 family lysozyme M1 (1,4-beta-N-acetylmuramidase)